MRKSPWGALSVVLILSLSTLVGSVSHALTISTDDGQGADSYIQGGGNANTAFGSASTVFAKNDNSISFGFTRKFYLRFDLASYSGDASVATLDLTVAFGGVGGFNIDVWGMNDGIAGESWDESTVTWNNAPANDTGSGSGVTSDATFLGQLAIPGSPATGQVIQFSDLDLISFINASTDDLATLIFTMPLTALATPTQFRARESGSGAPALYLVPEPSSAPLLLASGLAGLVLRLRRGEA